MNGNLANQEYVLFVKKLCNVCSIEINLGLSVKLVFSILCNFNQYCVFINLVCVLLG